VPTLEEAGYPGLEITEWQGIFVPAKTPPAIVDGLNRSVRAVPLVAARQHHAGEMQHRARARRSV
jgi:tripartite-type tricarboxylate transporter receptor subunit TctC